jgi:hypothetical protein
MKKLRFRAQLSLRSILLLIAVLSLPLGWYAPQLRAAIINFLTPVPDARFVSQGQVQMSQAWSSFEQMHSAYVNAFVESEGFGLRRMITFDDPLMRSLIVNGKPYRVQRLELISLNENERPFAYVNGFANPVKDGIAHAEQRRLTRFEQSSVAKLQAGRNVVYNGDEERPILVGAMRAGNSCLECHEVNKGEVIGCLSYELMPVMTASVDAEFLRQLGDLSKFTAGT